ncbi:hypothetical protein [Streptomyces sp. NPDC127038]|uniref:hypothetical protein n=1 Tax=Streptomyces sp. NPDC127038 TaxID=3347114 RepID=UPI0036481439
MTTARRTPFVPGLIPGPGSLLDWRDSRHFDHWQDKPCVLCDKPTPMRSHAGEAVHKACAEDWITDNPTEARAFGRFASDTRPKTSKSPVGDHA